MHEHNSHQKWIIQQISNQDRKEEFIVNYLKQKYVNKQIMGVMYNANMQKCIKTTES